MQIKKKVKLQKQTLDGTISLTFPKQIVELVGAKPGDIAYVCLDTETEQITIELGEK